jgi:hypothetical protein
MVRFQADADLNQIIVAALVRKNPLVDFRAASVASLSGLSDAQVLELAAAEGRTPDRKNYGLDRCPSGARPPM